MTGHANGVDYHSPSWATCITRAECACNSWNTISAPWSGHWDMSWTFTVWDRFGLSDAGICSWVSTIFGDERASYESLLKLIKNGTPDDWQETFISKYATAQAWGGWAETWATLPTHHGYVETAHFFWLKLSFGYVGRLWLPMWVFDPLHYLMFRP